MNALKKVTDHTRSTKPDGGISDFALARLKAANASLELVSSAFYACPAGEKMLAPRSVYRDGDVIVEIYDDRVVNSPAGDYMDPQVKVLFSGMPEESLAVTQQFWRSKYFTLAADIRAGLISFDHRLGMLLRTENGESQPLVLDEGFLDAIESHCERELQAMSRDLGMNLESSRADSAANNPLAPLFALRAKRRAEEKAFEVECLLDEADS